MRTPCFLFAAFIFGASTLGLSFAGEPAVQPREPVSSENRAKAADDRPADAGQQVQPRAGREQTDGKQADHKPAERPGSGKSAQTSGTRTTDKRRAGPKLPQPVQVKGGEHTGVKQTINTTTTAGNAAGPHQPAVNASAAAAKTGSTINKMEDHRGPPAAHLYSQAPPSHEVPHRGPGPAIIGGLPALSARNTAVINGTMMKHKP